MGWVDYEVRCDSFGELFRLHGRTCFNIAFGYGHAGVAEGMPGRVHLTETARQTLATALDQLGWDVGRLQEQRLRPVLNAIYGNAISAGMEKVAPFDGPAIDLDVTFEGPFSASIDAGCPCLFE